MRHLQAMTADTTLATTPITSAIESKTKVGERGFLNEKEREPAGGWGRGRASWTNEEVGELASADARKLHAVLAQRWVSRYNT